MVSVSMRSKSASVSRTPIQDTSSASQAIAMRTNYAQISAAGSRYVSGYLAFSPKRMKSGIADDFRRLSPSFSLKSQAIAIGKAYA